MDSLVIVNDNVVLFHINNMTLWVGSRSGVDSIYEVKIFREKTNPFTGEVSTEYYQFQAGCQSLEYANLSVVIDYINKLKNNTLIWPLS